MPIESEFDIKNYISKNETEDGTLIFDVTQRTPFDFDFDSFDEVKRVDQQDLRRPDKLANSKYSEPQFWWILMYVANRFFQVKDLEVADELNIPSGNDVLDFLERNRDA